MPRTSNQDQNKKPGSVAGDAALSICELLLIAMRDLKILGDGEVQKVLARAATKHHRASRSSGDLGLHKQATAIIERVAASHSSLPGRGSTPRSPAKSRTRN